MYLIVVDNILLELVNYPPNFVTIGNAESFLCNWVQIVHQLFSVYLTCILIKLRQDFNTISNVQGDQCTQAKSFKLLSIHGFKMIKIQKEWYPNIEMRKPEFALHMILKTI